MDGTNEAAAGQRRFDQPEEFTAESKLARKSLMAQLPMLVLLLVLFWFVIGLVMGALGVPGARFVAIPVAILVTGLLAWTRLRQLRTHTARARLICSPEGISVYEGQAWTRARWDQIQSADLVRPLVGYKSNFGGSSARTGQAIGAAAAELASQPQLGLLTSGTRELDADMALLTRKAYEQNEGRNGVDAQSGQQLYPMFPGHFDPRWTRGPIAEWIGRFRPDILEQARAHPQAGSY